MIKKTDYTFKSLRDLQHVHSQVKNWTIMRRDCLDSDATYRALKAHGIHTAEIVYVIGLDIYIPQASRAPARAKADIQIPSDMPAFLQAWVTRRGHK